MTEFEVRTYHCACGNDLRFVFSDGSFLATVFKCVVCESLFAPCLENTEAA